MFKSILMLFVALFLCAGTALAYDGQMGPETQHEQFAETAMICAVIYDGLAESGQFPYQKYKKLMKANVQYANRFVGKKTVVEIYEFVYPILMDQFGPNYANVDAMALEHSYTCQKASTLLPQALANAGK